MDCDEYEEVIEDEFADDECDENDAYVEIEEEYDEDEESEEEEPLLDEDDGSSETQHKSAPRTKSRANDEEEDWLKALEEGRLHEFDEELKKINDPKLMTARQRALLISKTEKQCKEELQAKSAARVEESLDKETVEKNLLKARKRRQQAEEKKEKDKKLTIERLLNKKSDSGSKGGGGGKGRKKKPEIPKISYINNANGIYICFPENTIPEFEVFSNFTKNTAPQKLESKQLCARNGCSNPKKYSCSRSGLPCCSLECYRLLEKSTPS
ncbi:INO80 complex subunit B-like protein [Dinothrombium tinctorium]|uniref:INO80 complex subunit B-like protein n=1 Tax=Dinothrombium tinctorium TaxID=1965070 RepID=A0A443QAC2_9ACAR|nr:INO80 complex subunit B-like protein [Dinothrombium tinctorium]